MKLYLLVISMCLVFATQASIKDSLFSTYLKHANYTYYPKIKQVDKVHFGSYSLVPTDQNKSRIAAGDSIKIDQNGIYIEKNKLRSISRETVRENSKYAVKNNYLHGIIAHDSIPVFIEDEIYYFLIPVKFYLYDISKTAVLRKINKQSYLIFNPEKNGFFSVMKIDFDNQKLSLSELDIPYPDIAHLNHSKIIENNLPTYIISPSESNWRILLPDFDIYEQYSKQL